MSEEKNVVETQEEFVFCEEALDELSNNKGDDD